MGFSVTAASVILVVAVLAAGSTLGAAVLRSHEGASEARRLDAKLQEAAAHTEIGVIASQWTAGQKRLTFDIDNNGTTTLDVRLLEFVVDGVWKTDKVESGWTVDAATTDWWAPATTLTISVRDTSWSSQPQAAVITTEYGAKAVWRP